MTEQKGPSGGRLLERGAQELSKAGVAEPRWEAELLLRHALGCSRESLLTHLAQAVPGEALGHFFQMIERRQGRVPLQYLTGEQEFWGLSMHVTPAVLIPRPETEGLIEQAEVELAGETHLRIADVGCGSGCVTIALASRFPEAELFGIDASPAALAVARENASRHQLLSRIEFWTGDLLTPFLERDETARLRAVVSNPPYIADADLDSLAPEVREHEPRLALSGGPSGLEVIERLIPQASASLEASGLLLLEIGQGQDGAVGEIVEAKGFRLSRIAPDLAGIPRVVVARKKLRE